jgi:superfamily II DNA helicase RecQ
MLTSPEFAPILQDRTFNDKLTSICFDEAHCIINWQSFRPEFKLISFIRYQLPWVSLYLTTATLPGHQLQYLKKLLSLDDSNTEIIRLSNNRPNIQLIAQEMKHAQSSYEDLLVFLGPSPSFDQPPPSPVIIYMNSKKDCEDGGTFLRGALKAIDPRLESKAAWFHSSNSKEFAQTVLEKLKSKEIWYLLATEILGMVSIHWPRHELD